MRPAMKKTKKDLVTLIKEDYPVDLRDVALHLSTKPVNLKNYKSDHRNSLKEDILNALLLLKANR